MKNGYINLTRNDTGAYPVSGIMKNFTKEKASAVRKYHMSFPEYSETPLAELKSFAANAGLKNVYLKDESFRFGLNAFKVLGGSYAIGNYIAEKLGRNMCDISFDYIMSDEVKAVLGDVTFITATDGNHGRGVAWTANRLGQKSIVYMPKGTAPERLENIKKLGSDASVKELYYDDCVRLAAAEAEKNGYALIQDTSFEGYKKIPMFVMQGYMTMVSEALEQLGNVRPTHIFLQAGVGSMAASAAAYVCDYYGENKPVIVIVEPHSANCLYLTASAADGGLHSCEGEMNSMMAGLCCGEPCPEAWEILRSTAEYFITIPDESAAKGMRALFRPSGADRKVVSGESGAATAGALLDIMTNPLCADIKSELSLDVNSVVLCFSTEGDTDKENFRKITEN